ncbi:MAG: hypothetical protein R3Y09_10515 [Clostridia bacterium]
MFIINSDVYQNALDKLIALSNHEDEKIAIKACTEILDRIEKKPKETALKWFINDEKN